MQRGPTRTGVECFNCHKRGHFARDCRTLKPQPTYNQTYTPTYNPPPLPYSDHRSRSQGEARSDDGRVVSKEEEVKNRDQPKTEKRGKPRFDKRKKWDRPAGRPVPARPDSQQNPRNPVRHQNVTKTSTRRSCCSRIWDSTRGPTRSDTGRA